jgi:dipeptidyl-peptidase-4
MDGSGQRERLTPEDAPGTHAYQVAPGGGWAIHTYSTFTTPPVIDLVELPDHRSARTFVDNEALRARVAALNRGEAEFIRVAVDDGVELDGFRMLPPDFDPAQQYPVLFYVYGEPAGQTVLDQWGGTQYLWHLMLTQQGYIVMSFDNRGTPAPRGRAWRKVVYGSVGVLASRDQAQVARAVAAWPYVDAARLGIWGWSGGGSMTLNAMFRYPDLYRTGMSVAPVPDQRYYDTIYQERYMGTPQGNPGGYREGSPITFAEQLEGNLLIVHGTGDDNVHYQGTEALINKLVAHNKDFTMMSYPNRTHGIYEGRGTTRHLYGLLTRYLNDNLPPGPVTQQPQE